MTYLELSAAIQTYSENYETDFIASIPTFIKQTEQRVYNTVTLPSIRKNQNATMTAGNKYLTLPSDYLADFSIATIDPTTQAQTYLLNKDVNFVREAYPNPTTQGAPKHYAQFDQNTLILGPTPNAAYTVELHYYAYPQSIVDAGTSWLGDHFDSVLLYGSLGEAAVFMKAEADMVTYYKSQFDSALALLKDLGDGKARRDAYRSGQERIPKK